MKVLFMIIPEPESLSIVIETTKVGFYYYSAEVRSKNWIRIFGV